MRSTIGGRPGARRASARREGVIRTDGECGCVPAFAAPPCRARPPRDRPGRARGCVALPAAAGAQGGTGGAQPEAARRRRRPRRAARPSLPPVRSKVRLTRLACASALRRGRRRPPRRAAARARHGHAPHRRGALRRRRRARPTTSPPRRSSAARPRSTCACRSAPPPARSRCSTATACSPAPAPAPLAVEQPPAAVPAAGGPSIDVDVQAPKAYFDAARPMRISYVVHDDRPVNVRVELVRVDGPGRDRELGARRRAARDAAGRAVERHGRRPRAEAGPLRRSASAPPTRRARCAPRAPRRSPARPPAEPDPAVVHVPAPHFPVLGPHGYGEFAAKFGGGRGHQGQDVFAACGTPLVAARGGIVKFKQYHSRAGYYLVIDGEQHRRRLRLHAPARRPRSSTRASACAPAS